jgi:diguanylate cyclase (GGDEF)-like protein
MLSHAARLAAYIGHARTRHLLAICGLVLGIGLAASLGWIILDLRSDHIEHGEQDLTSLSLILAEEIDHQIQGIELLQVSLIDHMRQIGIASPAAFDQAVKSFEVHEDLARRIAGMPHVAALSLHDANGELINFSRAWPAPQIAVRDRDFIQMLLGPSPPPIFISEPSLSLTTGKQTIYFSQRFEAPDGQLIGIVLSTIFTDSFEQLYAQIASHGERAFNLYRSDGMLLVRYPESNHAKIGAAFGETENYRRVIETLDHGAAQFNSVLDGRQRLVAGHRVAHYPLIITVSDTIDAILASWREEAIAVGVAIGCLELVIASTVVLAFRHLRGHELLQIAETARAQAEERERGAQALQLQGMRFDTALANRIPGLLMFDGAGRLLVANRRFGEMFGMAIEDIPPGTSYAELTARVVTHGNVRAADIVPIRERRQQLIAADERKRLTWEMEDGRILLITHQPMEDGWLATYDDVTEHRKAEAKVIHLAHHDALTDLPNRVLFRQRLEEALARARRGQGLALLCLDLDRFKAVNDTLGHPVGDDLLQAVAARLLERTRQTDTVARLGGDEFAIIQSVDGPTEATTFAARLNELLDEPFNVAGHQIVIGTSIGIAFAPQDSIDADELLKSADLALYRAKLDGRGVYRLFHAEMDAQMQARRLLELDLRQAVRTGQLVLFYQPLVDPRSNAVTGFEALLRWDHPAQGLITPDRFIALAEEIGLIVPIGEWVLREACSAVASWPGTVRIAVNLSPAQFKSRNLIPAVEQALRESGLAADRLELEITETIMLQDTATTLATLHKLRALGVTLAMDDFGTGYSSLSYLRRFPFDRIKIDQSFVRDVCIKSDCGAIVRAVAGLSSELGMATTAEGVETSQQLDALIDAGCTEVQGYLFSPAVPAEAVPALLRRIADMPTAHAEPPRRSERAAVVQTAWLQA